jgi:hypothetical protein
MHNRVGTGRLQFPCHLYFLGRGKVCKYGLASKTTGAFVTLPSTDRAGRRHQARHIVHSAKQNAWLVFFESAEPPAAKAAEGPDGGAEAAAAAGDPLWEFCLVKENLSTSDQGAWFLPGALVAWMLCGGGLVNPAVARRDALPSQP